MVPNFGPLEILIVLVIALVVFGPRRLPELGSSLGRGIRGFGKSLNGEGGDARGDDYENASVAVAQPPSAQVSRPDSTPIP